MSYDVDFNPDLFNNVYWHLRRAFNNPLLRYIWLYGGSSASKTYSVVQLQIVRMMCGENENAMIMRKFAVDIKDSIYADFKTIIKEWGLEEYFTVQLNFIRCDRTGSYVRFRGLDDSEKIKGLSGFKRVILEEVSQFDEEDLKQIRKRLRGKVGQQIIGIFNPIWEEHWIKKNVFDEEILTEVPTDISGMWVNDKGNLLILKTNYLDNVFIVGRWEVGANGKLVQIGGTIDQHVIDDFEKDKVKDNAYYQIYGLGEWGKIRTGGEFWKDFNSNIHKTKIGWNEDLPVFMWLDENVNPYITCGLFQIYGTDNKKVPGKKVAIQFDEICLEDPLNRVIEVCKEFKKRYPFARVAGMFIGGDRTSVKEDTKLEKGENFFTKFQEHLSDYKPTLRMQSVNPSIVQSAGFVNACYRGETGVALFINERCKKSLYDYEYAPEDSDGTLKKIKVKNKKTGVTYELYGHPSDMKRYFMTVNFAGEYTEYLKGGRKTNVRMGKNTVKHGY